MLTVLCSGSRGDFQPYIALAQQLKKLGKDVRITGSKSFEGFIRSYGIDVYPIEADIETLSIDPKLLKAAGPSDNPIKMLLTFNKMKEYGIYMVNDYYSACEGSELIIYWMVEEPCEYTPSKDLEAFLNSGEKPVYIGFGSIFLVKK